MLYEQFLNDLRPIKNHLCDSAPFDGLMFETIGEEYEYIKQLMAQGQNKRIWTLQDDGLGTFINSGFHFVNRLGYFVTEEEWKNDWESVDLENDYDEEN